MVQAKGAWRLSGLVVLLILTILLTSCGGEPEDAGSSSDRGGEGTEDTSTAGRDGAGEEALSVRDMVGQMFVVSLGGTEPDYYIEKMVRERNIGGVLLFGYNMETEEGVRDLTSSLQRLSMETEPGIPLFVAVDYEGGEVASAPWVTPQPAAAEVGAGGDPAVAGSVSESIGEELLRAGVNTDFAPVVDTGFGAAIGSRSYGEDPALVAEMGSAAVEGFERAGIVSSAKHFPNHGPASVDSHEGLPVVEHDAATLRDYDLPPFRAAVEAGVPMVMVGHLVYPVIDPERPASLSPEAIRLLREDLGFEGVVVSDDLAMAGATASRQPGDAAVEAVAAGVDLLIISSAPQQQADAYDAVVGAVESGELSRERIRQSYERIVEVKRRYGLYERAGG